MVAIAAIMRNYVKGTMMDQRINSTVYVVVLSKPMNFLLSVSPSEEMGDRTGQRVSDFGGNRIQRSWVRGYLPPGIHSVQFMNI